MPKKFPIVVFLALLALPAASLAQNVTVDWTDVHQQIDGFGASDMFCPSALGYDSCNLTDAQADLFFSPTKGMGLSILRVQIPPDESCLTTCSTRGIVTMEKALARGARILAVPATPPTSMKSNKTRLCSGGIGSLLPGSYGEYATYLKNYVQQFASKGVPIYALSLQNEPDACTGGTTFQATWTGASLHDFILNSLGPAFAAAGLTTKLMIPETVKPQYVAEMADATMNDPAAAAYVGLIGTHNYSSDQYPPVAYTNGGKPEWMSEVSDLDGADASITSALTYAASIHTWLATKNAQAWLYWWLVNGNAGDNEGLIQKDGTTTKRLYMMGNWTKFVRPGWNRIGTSGSAPSGVSVSAYGDAQGHFAVVAINQSISDIPLTLALNGLTAGFVTPWITSASLNLAQQAGVPVTNGAFNAALPASSITTFVGTADSFSAPLP